MRNGVDDRNRGQATRVERTLQFRAEAFNLTNTPWFGAVNSGQFGQVTKLQTNDLRSLQLALRLNFQGVDADAIYRIGRPDAGDAILRTGRVRCSEDVRPIALLTKIRLPGSFNKAA